MREQLSEEARLCHTSGNLIVEGSVIFFATSSATYQGQGQLNAKISLICNIPWVNH